MDAGATQLPLQDASSHEVGEDECAPGGVYVCTCDDDARGLIECEAGGMLGTCRCSTSEPNTADGGATPVNDAGFGAFDGGTGASGAPPALSAEETVELQELLDAFNSCDPVTDVELVVRHTGFIGDEAERGCRQFCDTLSTCAPEQTADCSMLCDSLHDVGCNRSVLPYFQCISLAPAATLSCDPENAQAELPRLILSGVTTQDCTCKAERDLLQRCLQLFEQQGDL